MSVILLLYITIAMISYLIGSISFSIVLSNAVGIGDIRSAGSGNAGATNMARVGGIKLGAMTFILDAMKGVVCILFAKYLSYKFGFSIFDIINISVSESKLHEFGLASLALFSSVFGHIFPIWHRFKGGKGVAIFLGAVVTMNYIIGTITVSAWIVVFALFRIASVASIASVVVATVLFGITIGANILVFPVLLACLLIVYMHKQNIRRLVKTHGKTTFI